MVRTRLKLAATLTVVVLALTGFQTSSSGGHGSGKSSSRSGKSKSSGGGCSSSKKKNDDYDDYDGSGSVGGSTSTPTSDPSTYPKRGVEVVVVDCVKPAQKKRKGKPARKADTTATLRIVSRNWESGTYLVTLEFKDRTGTAVDRAETRVTIASKESKNFEIAMTAPGVVGRVTKCYVYDVRAETTASPTATPTASATASPSS
ncbi:hypothetical protein [Streptomyces sp. NPDC051921]|uniref:hypothetical protein n=1 Tax=Streptomyces sp. NPDC051921 TaxID=3155806 RepID=UPI0034484178